MNKETLKKLYTIFILFLSVIWGGIILIYGFVFWFILYIINLLTRKLPIDAKDFNGPYTYTYKIIENRELKLDIYYPKTKKIYPVIFFTHGGGWVSGFRNQKNNVSWCEFLASKGFAVVSIDYRLGISHTMNEILSDYTDALNYIKKNSKELLLDKNNIVLMGLSAGGHLTLLYYAYYTFVKNEKNIEGIKGIVAYYTPSNLRHLFDKNVKSVFAKVATAATLKAFPTPTEEGKFLYYSPIFWINENMKPVLLVHGKKDKTVPFSSSVELLKKLKEKGVQTKILVHKNGDHAFEFENRDIQTIRILHETIKFIRSLVENEN
ncbi:Acetyl esterase/lipase [Marinitoga hydrogenitolerans DSM 16785]|uniref:Acetyl esterase/lipase n=1 Tax=Marinitoga hydrogenitolerans (strain DSM 16785 / JCM 12826 / AT1271) TaxID=1122195 RepID=A0A1M4ZJW2_MARH1|nr:alpha/beta hydrolase [Marinitoga hydrogenitolerans]SHF18329.1 Acetyl esterase/lipase [Marinitoga hydrogenitolerans DSM 16785]